MTRRRRRRRSRRRGPDWRRYGAVALVVGVVFVATAFPASSFLSATADRGSTTDVVVDGQAIAGLDIAGTVATGSTDRLVSVTNNFSQSVRVTVSLDPGSTDVGTLVVGGATEGDSATFDLGIGSTQPVDVDVPCDDSLAGRTVAFTVAIDGPGLDGTVERAETSVRSQCGYVAYVGENNKKIHAVDSSGDIITFDNKNLPQGMGPYRYDLDGDGLKELPYEQNGYLKIIDAENRTQTIALEPNDKARYAVADVDDDGTPGVVYANSTDNKYLYRAEYGQGVTRIGSGIPAQSVAGVVDFDGDGSLDIVFTVGGTLKYAQAEAGWAVTSTGVDPSNQQSVGRPADFDGDGTVRVPIYNTDDQVALVDSAGNVEVLNSTYRSGSSKRSLAAIDWDGDGSLDVVTVNKDDNSRPYYMRLDGTLARMIRVELHENEVGVV